MGWMALHATIVVIQMPLVAHANTRKIIIVAGIVTMSFNISLTTSIFFFFGAGSSSNGFVIEVILPL